MKFFYWGPYTGFVGTIQGMVSSAAALREHGGHEVCLLRCYNEWKETQEDIDRAGLRVLDLGLAKFFCGLNAGKGGYALSRLYNLIVTVFAPWRLAKAIDREKPDCIVTCLLVVPLLLACALARHKPKIVSIVWGYPNFLLARNRRDKNPCKTVEGWLRRYLWKLFYRRIDLIAATSAGTKADLEREFAFVRGRIFVMRVPVALPRLSVLALEDCPHPWLQERDPERPVLVGVGRLTRQKGFDTLLRAFAQVRQEIDARLILLGEGELRAELEALCRSLPLRLRPQGVDGAGGASAVSAVVDLPGFAKNPFCYLARASAFVLSSRWEDPCHAIIEAGCVGVPIVTTDCPSGPADFVLRGEAGEVCPVDDIDGMASALLRVLRSPDHGAAKAEKARAHAGDYTPQAHFRQLTAVLERGVDAAQ